MEESQLKWWGTKKRYSNPELRIKIEEANQKKLGRRRQRNQ